MMQLFVDSLVVSSKTHFRIGLRYLNHQKQSARVTADYVSALKSKKKPNHEHRNNSRSPIMTVEVKNVETVEDYRRLMMIILIEVIKGHQFRVVGKQMIEISYRKF